MLEFIFKNDFDLEDIRNKGGCVLRPTTTTRV